MYLGAETISRQSDYQNSTEHIHILIFTIVTSQSQRQ